MKNTLSFDPQKDRYPILTIAESEENAVHVKIIGPSSGARLEIYYATEFKTLIDMETGVPEKEIRIPGEYCRDNGMIHIRYVDDKMKSAFFHIIGDESLYNDLVLVKKTNYIFYCAGNAKQGTDTSTETGTIDKELNANSSNAVTNQAITKAINEIEAEIETIVGEVDADKKLAEKYMNDTKAICDDITEKIQSGEYELGWDSIANKPEVFMPPPASSTTRGGILLGFTVNNANRNFPVLTSSEKAYVNLPAGASATYGVVKIRNDLAGTETTGTALSAAQGKALNDKFSYKKIEKQGTGAVSTSSVFSSAKELVVQVTESSSGNYYTYTWTINPKTIGDGNGVQLLSGYKWGTVEGFCRVRLGRETAELLNCITGNTDYSSSCTLTINYR